MNVRRLWIAGYLLTGSLLLAGCNRSVEIADDADPAELASAEDASQPSRTAKQKVADEIVIPPASFVGRETHESRFPGTQRVEARLEVRKYSDNSIKLDGKYTEYWHDGGTFVEGTYRDDRRHGVRRYYHPNGQLARETVLQDGRPHGAWTRYRADGSKEMDVSYQDGQRHGTWMYYSEPETPAEEDASEEESVESDDAGSNAAEVLQQRIVRQEEYKHGKLDGLVVTWHPNGNKSTEITFKEGEKHGTERSWFDSGDLRTEANFVNGKADGLVTIWNQEGKVVTQREFHDGRPVQRGTVVKR